MFPVFIGWLFAIEFFNFRRGSGTGTARSERQTDSSFRLLGSADERGLRILDRSNSRDRGTNGTATYGDFSRPSRLTTTLRCRRKWAGRFGDRRDEFNR